MRRSFRLKIALLSAGLSGLLLVALGLYATAVLNRVGRERIDRELRALADAQVRIAHQPGHWVRFGGSLRSVFGAGAERQFVIKVNRLDGTLLYETTPWPEELPPAGLPLSIEGAPRSVLDGPPPEAPGARPPPAPLLVPGPRPPPDGAPQPMPIRGPVYATLGGPHRAWRAMTIANEDVALTIALDLAGLRAEIARFDRALLVAVPLGLLLIVGAGWLTGHLALRPVALIARTAESVSADRLDRRIPATRVDAEFRRLIDVINGMLGRLERSFRQATRFSADAAHELKTPVAVLQAQIEHALQRAPDGTGEQRVFAEQLEEVQRLKAILRKLLLLSQADAGRLPLSRTRLDLAELARAAAEDARLLAPDRAVRIDAPAALPVEGDTDLLQQVLGNLVSNAVKFGEAGSAIAIATEAQGGRAILRTTNAGTPIAEADRERLFERFYRADPARGRETDGAGLGLSLAREIALAHGGDLVLERSDGEGTTFTLTLPLAPLPEPS